MKKLKRQLGWITFLALFVLTVLGGCTSNPENNLTGEWEAVEYIVNEEDQLAFTTLNLELLKDGTFHQSIIKGEMEQARNGEWSYDHDQGMLHLEYENSVKNTWDIIQTEDDHLHMTNSETAGFFVEWKFKRVE